MRSQGTEVLLCPMPSNIRNPLSAVPLQRDIPSRQKEEPVIPVNRLLYLLRLLTIVQLVSCRSVFYLPDFRKPGRITPPTMFTGPLKQSSHIPLRGISGVTEDLLRLLIFWNEWRRPRVPRPLVHLPNPLRIAGRPGGNPVRRRQCNGQVAVHDRKVFWRARKVGTQMQLFEQYRLLLLPETRTQGTRPHEKFLKRIPQRVATVVWKEKRFEAEVDKFEVLWTSIRDRCLQHP
mmetsp:Transcript_50595/g.99539  ORF Transcript_50595/g.99539 Transcript_50595/m.99539 type:complete len:233 (-) Transcript_50595:672-1370(-)